MAQQVFADGESLASVQAKLNGNANDAEARFGALAEEIAAKQAILSSGTNIKTVNGLSLLGSGDLVVGGGLTGVDGANEAVTMISNREYDVDLSGFSAIRDYVLPAATKGNRMRVNLLAGHASHAIVLKGAEGVTINGGSGASEWSRLFIGKEWAEFRATSSTNWDIYNDGRIAQECFMDLTSTVTNHYANDASTKIPLDTIRRNVGDIASLANDNCALRRACRIAVSGAFYCDGLSSTTNQIICFAIVGSESYRGSWVTRATSGASGAAAFISIASVDVASGATVHIAGYQNDGGTRNATYIAGQVLTYLSVRELL